MERAAKVPRNDDAAGIIDADWTPHPDTPALKKALVQLRDADPALKTPLTALLARIDQLWFNRDIFHDDKPVAKRTHDDAFKTPPASVAAAGATAPEKTPAPIRRVARNLTDVFLKM